MMGNNNLKGKKGVQLFHGPASALPQTNLVPYQYFSIPIKEDMKMKTHDYISAIHRPMLDIKYNHQ